MFQIDHKYLNCVSEWSQYGAEWKSANNVQGRYAQGILNAQNNFKLNFFVPQVTETEALIEKHFYRIEVIQKVLAKKAMEEEER